VTHEERMRIWEQIKALYIDWTKARADAKALATIMASELGISLHECEERLSDARQSLLYQNYIKRAEDLLVPIESALAQQHERELLDLLAALPIPKDLN
jgi:hypothetical protein